MGSVCYKKTERVSKELPSNQQERGAINQSKTEVKPKQQTKIAQIEKSQSTEQKKVQLQPPKPVQVRNQQDWVKKKPEQSNQEPQAPIQPANQQEQPQIQKQPTQQNLPKLQQPNKQQQKSNLLQQKQVKQVFQEISNSQNNRLSLLSFKNPVERIQNYILDQTRDYFRVSNPQCTTILNSETAAIKRAIELLQTPGPFLDPDFGPEQAENGAFCIYWQGSPPNSNYPPPETLQWLSIKQGFQGQEFVDQNLAANDVIQGTLGDCWFIGALSVLATRNQKVLGSVYPLLNPEMINQGNIEHINTGVFPPIFHCLANRGLYILRFHKDAQWRYVITDDRVPVYKESGTPQYVFGHCRNEKQLWVPLIQKAYAKLHGCYQSLNGGLIDDGLVDMTGFVAQKLKISNSEDRQTNNELWRQLGNYIKNKTLMGCSIESENVESEVIWYGSPTGLLARHAYGLLSALEVPTLKNPESSHRLLRLRNPWGYREWNGKWSDQSQELLENADIIKYQIARLDPQEIFDPQNTQDGTFLICFKDWRSLFHNFFACVDFPSHWWGVRFSSQWTSENSGGIPTSNSPEQARNWAKNPQFILSLQTSSEVFISLLQPDGRYVKNSVFPYQEQIFLACFTIIKIQADQNRCNQFDQKKIVKLSKLKAHKEVHLRLDLQPGKYAVVPATRYPGKTGYFWVSFYFSGEKPLISVKAADQEVSKKSKIAQQEQLAFKIKERRVPYYQEILVFLNSVSSSN